MLEYLKTYRDIALIYKKLFTEFDHMCSLDVLDLYREYLKLSVKLGTNSPVFDEKFGKYAHCNCYCYALGITAPYEFVKRYEYKEIDDLSHNLGFMDDRFRYSLDLDMNLSGLQSDLELLGIDSYETTMLHEPSHNGYKIAFFKAYDDFHFIRQNSDGSWSHKLGYTPKIERIEMPQERVLGRYNYVKTLEIVKPVIRK